LGCDAFVAGATGYVGREVVRVARERDLATVAHVRPDSPRLATWRERFERLGVQVDSTPWDDSAFVATMTRLRPSIIFALLGTTKKRAQTDPQATYERVDYGMTATLLRAAVAAGHGLVLSTFPPPA
jgi:nucleoside-diphosphate-sugar epimerase